MLEKIEFRKYSNPMMKKITKDLNELKKTNKVILFADKSSNIYKIDREKYEKLLFENVTKNYTKTKDNTITNINDEAQNLITKKQN